MSQHRSISQRLNRAKSKEAKAAALVDWISGWKREQDTLIAQLERAVSRNDYHQTCITLGQLKAVINKKMTALPTVISHLMIDKNEP